MPVVQSPNKALVTGANGFVAMWVVRDLLEHGYVVRGTVRSVEKGEYLKNYFAPYASKFEVTTVEDMKEHSMKLSKVLRQLPVLPPPKPTKGTRVEDMVETVINGTTGLLRSALTYGQSVKSIVYASTGGAAWPETSEFQTFTVLTEEDWNVRAIEILKERGDETPAITAYHASKTLAEQSAWKFVKDHDGKMD
ncbi:hypothetical protein F5141DRAFT_1218292 [Pisolithus sp. B1]|nr:hypothetical protein F5141DRAFT_1218292 [Pisolithus sp. B1]